MKFIPLMVREIRSIYESQVLRGANMLPKDLLRSWNWPDFINCLLVPAIVRTLSLSGEIALAARARDFGIKKKRSCWPGE
jgi:energy-coupling factor transport system permease protein